jgi:hypothetical protein
MDDLSVLMGAVMAKKWTGHNFKDTLIMLLYVSADRENAFGEQHIPLMRCCTDALSGAVNVILRAKVAQHV